MLEMKGGCWHRAKEELVKAGMEREFVGRLPVRVALQALSDEDLFQVLTPLSCSQSFTCVCCGCCSQSRYRIRGKPYLNGACPRTAEDGATWGQRSFVTLCFRDILRLFSKLFSLSAIQ